MDTLCARLATYSPWCYTGMTWCWRYRALPTVVRIVDSKRQRTSMFRVCISATMFRNAFGNLDLQIKKITKRTVLNLHNSEIKLTLSPVEVTDSVRQYCRSGQPLDCYLNSNRTFTASITAYCKYENDYIMTAHHVCSNCHHQRVGGEVKV